MTTKEPRRHRKKTTNDTQVNFLQQNQTVNKEINHDESFLSSLFVSIDFRPGIGLDTKGTRSSSPKEGHELLTFCLFSQRLRIWEAGPKRNHKGRFCNVHVSLAYFWVVSCFRWCIRWQRSSTRRGTCLAMNRERLLVFELIFHLFLSDMSRLNSAALWEPSRTWLYVSYFVCLMLYLLDLLYFLFSTWKFVNALGVF